MLTNIHVHSPTCYKPPSGSNGCRGAKPSGLVEKTMPVELEEQSTNDRTQIPTVKTNISPKQDHNQRNITIKNQFHYLITESLFGN